ncbi:hypothetical protein HAX54_031247 [Datura stramonium]|uniref:Uncharacterized protein n=1 Tax=Datura stramonium TaxID=4076 RepID=A0ABS8VBR4_DATST|nr:hypothetical protein [Datura stramonium]
MVLSGTEWRSAGVARRCDMLARRSTRFLALHQKSLYQACPHDGQRGYALAQGQERATVTQALFGQDLQAESHILVGMRTPANELLSGDG